MFNEAWAAVTEATGKTLRGTQNRNIEIADLRDEIVAFEVMGPKSSRVIAGALNPDWIKSSKKARKVCLTFHAQESANFSAVLGHAS